jgi:hypothetical protein
LYLSLKDLGKGIAIDRRDNYPERTIDAALIS